jgi:hypothetical protein
MNWYIASDGSAAFGKHPNRPDAQISIGKVRHGLYAWSAWAHPDSTTKLGSGTETTLAKAKRRSRESLGV